MKRLISAATLLAFLVPFARGAPAETMAPEDRRAVRDAIIEQLKDPDSAHFRPLYNFHLFGADRNFGVCAPYNARNSYGGYNGFTVAHVEAQHGRRQAGKWVYARILVIPLGDAAADFGC